MLHLAAQHRDFDLRDSSRFFGLVLDALTLSAMAARLREIIPAFVEREKKLAIASLQSTFRLGGTAGATVAGQHALGRDRGSLRESERTESAFRIRSY